MNFIFHLDMDSFFASIEIRDHPNIKNLPVVVCSKTFSINANNIKGVVSSASYISRNYGVVSAMPLSKAINLCPNLVYFPLNIEYYKIVSHNIFSIILKKYSKTIEKSSIDEAYFEISSISSYDEAEKIAKNIKNDIYINEKLTCSIGISCSKILAKIASGLNKPNSISIINPDNMFEKLYPLSITKIPGIGYKTKEKLNNIGIFTIFDLYNSSLFELKKYLCKRGIFLYNLVQNLSTYTPLVTKNQKSIKRYKSIDIDINNKYLIIDYHKYLFSMYNTLIEELYGYLYTNHISYKTISVHIIYRNNFSISKSKTLIVYNCNINILKKITYRLINGVNSKIPLKFIRQIGIGVSNLSTKKEYQMTLNKYYK